MGVEFFHHGGDGFVLKFVGVWGLDIVVADIPHHLVELAAAFDVDLALVDALIHVKTHQDA